MLGSGRHSFCRFDLELRVVVGVFHEGPTHEPVGECFGDVFLAVVLGNDDVEGVISMIFGVEHSAFERVRMCVAEPGQFFEERTRHAVRYIHEF